MDVSPSSVVGIAITHFLASFQDPSSVPGNLSLNYREVSYVAKKVEVYGVPDLYVDCVSLVVPAIFLFARCR